MASQAKMDWFPLTPEGYLHQAEKVHGLLIAGKGRGLEPFDRSVVFCHAKALTGRCLGFSLAGCPGLGKRL